MKAKLLLVCCAMALFLSACGDTKSDDSGAATPTEKTVDSETVDKNSQDSVAEQSQSDVMDEEKTATQWELEQELDEFGDVKKDGDTFALYEISGTFSNTATNNSELGGYVAFNPNEKYFAFNLLEYNDTNATYTSSDMMILKYKKDGDDTVYTHYLSGNAPNAPLYLEDKLEAQKNEEYHNVSTESGFQNIGEQLWSGNSVRCIIEIGSSSYNFTIESSNFAEICNSLQVSFAPIPKEEAITYALEKYISGEKHEFCIGNSIELAGNYLVEYSTKEDIILGDSLKELLVGRWALYSFHSSGSAICAEFQEDGNWFECGSNHLGEPHAHVKGERPNEWSIEDDRLHMLRRVYTVYDLGQEGYYLLKASVTGDTIDETSSFIIVRLDDTCNPMYPIEPSKD